MAKPVSNEPPTSGGQEINYLSWAVHSSTTFTIEEGSGFNIQAEFQAPVDTVTWPAFWLNGADTWPPEIDLAEWKASSEIQSIDMEYDSPDNFHAVRTEIRDEDGSNTSVSFYLYDTEVTTQYGRGYVRKPLYL
ncbi:hypothetical protein EYZ11_007210 [Aspergillus tanneri]|uniref:GH16 domain-containing protein n=1 Tax=Aspergillus tanneri TaxID=1220188 RepID=A0A4S3JJ72_9EURO|nr:hypothetical protein EYZ11_007210 [Aspergillus tanneri]